MADVFTPARRSQIMAGIRGKNTKPELAIRKGLHSMGFRFSLHKKSLPGSPDLVLRKWGAVIFVHGCFWHGHDCDLYRNPKSNTELWGPKIARNRERDQECERSLVTLGWRVLNIWECALKGKGRIGEPEALRLAAEWIRSDLTRRIHQTGFGWLAGVA